MTVIAYKNGRMACDSLCVDLNTGAHVSMGTKIYRTKAGALIGESGDADSRAFRTLMDNVKSGVKLPSTKDLADTHCDGNFLVVFKTGEVWAIDIYPYPEMEQWHASACQITGMHSIAHAGCGGELAMAFMRSGCSAREAVKRVCAVNAYCAEPVYEVALKKPAQQSKASGPSARKARK